MRLFFEENSNHKLIQFKNTSSSDLNIDFEKFQKLIKLIHCSLESAILHHGINSTNLQKLAVISGAGIAGLAASFELIRKGYKVIITEKRTEFTRFNIINLDVDVRRFLGKFGLLDEFEKNVAGKIIFHKYMLATSEGMQHLQTCDVSQLQENNTPFLPEFFDKLYNEDGVYSVKIRDLQNFLAQKALDAGVHILGNVEAEILLSNKVVVRRFYDEIELRPDLVLIAEGAHSETATQLGMDKYQIENECTGENWIFGNARYHGSQTFVVCVIDTSGDNLELANIIFNSKVHEINIAITSGKNLSQEGIKERLLDVLNKVLIAEKIDETPEIISMVTSPVYINNEKRNIYSKNNSYCIGDASGHSSPLAGSGGCNALILAPAAVEQLITDKETNNPAMDANFHKFTDGSVSRWIDKSVNIKRRCLGIFAEKKQVAIDDVEISTSMENRG